MTTHYLLSAVQICKEKIQLKKLFCSVIAISFCTCAGRHFTWENLCPSTTELRSSHKYKNERNQASVQVTNLLSPKCQDCLIHHRFSRFVPGSQSAARMLPGGSQRCFWRTLLGRWCSGCVRAQGRVLWVWFWACYLPLSSNRVAPLERRWDVLWFPASSL